MSKRLMVFIALCLLLVGCSSKKAILPGMTVEEKKDGSYSVQTKDGTVEVASSDDGKSVKIPDGFPHKLMDGYKAQSALKATSDGKANFTLALDYPGKKIGQVADFFEAELKALGVEVSRTEMTDSQSGTTIILNGDGSKVGAWISLLEDLENKTVQVALMYGMK